ncbi:hypothetical protein [Marivirga lumbricoides]
MKIITILLLTATLMMACEQKGKEKSTIAGAEEIFGLITNLFLH